MSLLSVAFDTGQESTSGMHASTSATTAAGSDETLLARYRKGDSAAFEVLYQRHRQGLYRFLCGLPDRPNWPTRSTRKPGSA